MTESSDLSDLSERLYKDVSFIYCAIVKLFYDNY